MQELGNIEKPWVLFLNKTKHIIKPTNIWTTWEILILQTFMYQMVTDNPIY